MSACRQREDCTAWFWCKDAEGRPCFDLQSGSWVNWHGCKLMDVPLLPADAFDPADMKTTSDAAYYRNYATGYIKSVPLPVACRLSLFARPAQAMSSIMTCSALRMLTADCMPPADCMLRSHLILSSLYVTLWVHQPASCTASCVVVTNNSTAVSWLTCESLT